MQRWQATTLGAGGAILAALLVPSLHAITPDSHALRTVEAPEPMLFPAPPADDPGGPSIQAGLDQSVLLRGEGADRYLVISLDAPEQTGGPPVPLDVALVVDTSGSMAGANKIAYAQAAIRSLADQLDESDRLSIVPFSSRAWTELPLTSAAATDRIHRAIDRLRASGGTQLGAGLAQGLQQLTLSESTALQRVVILSDGLSSESLTELTDLTSQAAEAGVTVSALGLGLDFDASKLMAISDAGGGRYHYVSDPGALAQMFDEELRNMAAVACAEVRVELKMAEGVEIVAVHGYEEWDGARTLDGYRTFIGDMHGEQQRKVVAQVRIPEGAAPRSVAAIEVSWTDPESGERRHATRDVVASFTRDPNVAAASIDPTAAALAARALTGVALQQSVAEWRGGDTTTAEETLSAQLDRLDVLTKNWGLDLSSERRTVRRRLDAQSRRYSGSESELDAATLATLESLGYME